MRERKPLVTLLTMAASGLVMAGCVDDSATTSPSAGASSAGASSSTVSASAGGPVASCVTGNWRSTTVGAQAANGAASANVSGGGGVAVTVGANGQTTVDFSNMQPVAFTATAAGTEVSGRFTLAGKVAGTVRTGPATASSEGTSGSWEPAQPIDWGDTRVTVDLTQPMKVRVLDNAQLDDYVGDGASRTGNVIDVEPLLGKGRYQCTGDTLVLTPDDGGMSWTLSRA